MAHEGFFLIKRVYTAHEERFMARQGGVLPHQEQHTPHLSIVRNGGIWNIKCYIAH